MGEIEATFLEKLEACGEEEDGCRAMLLRALSNAGLPGTIPTLLQHAENAKQAMISEAAVKALRRMDKQYITSEVLSIFFMVSKESLIFIAMEIMCWRPLLWVIPDYILVINETEPRIYTKLTKKIL